MKTFDVYPLFDIEPVKAKNCSVWDKNGVEYLDFYGGHAVISIGHCHPVYQKEIGEQLSKIGFYSNSVQIPLQQQVASKLGELSGYEDYDLFFCNSGAEANENAIKVASFYNKRTKVIAFKGAFHGRTSGAVVMSDNQKIIAPFNASDHVRFLPLNDIVAFKEAMSDDICAVIIEGIQGIGGVICPEPTFLCEIASLCQEHDVVLILDEVQSGFGRSGKFFAHQIADIKPDIITVAKGMGNGFPVGGTLISPKFKAWPGMLGSTFGGNHLACAAVKAVLEVIETENLMKNATQVGDYLKDKLQKLAGVKEVRGQGLMLGVDFTTAAAPIRKHLLQAHRIFTGSSSTPNTMRLLPPLTITQKEANRLLEALKQILSVL